MEGLERSEIILWTLLGIYILGAIPAGAAISHHITYEDAMELGVRCLMWRVILGGLIVAMTVVMALGTIGFLAEKLGGVER